MKTLQRAILSSISKNKNNNALWIEDKFYTYKKLENLSKKYRKIYSKNNSSKVCILAEKNIYCYAAILATVVDGRVYVPLNPKFPVEKNKQMLDSSGAKILIIQSKFINQINYLAKNIKDLLIFIPDINKYSKNKKLSKCYLFTKKDFDSKDTNLSTFFTTKSQTNCYLLFTSGSTGKPKGVPINNMNIMSYLNNVYQRYKPNKKDRFSHNFDLTFDLSIHDIFLCWLSGACLYVSPKSLIINPGHFIKKNKLTFWFSVPSLGLNMSKMKLLKKNSFKSLRQTLFCGEALPQSLVMKWNDAAPNSKIDNLYGPTESTVAILGYEWKRNTSRKESVNGIVPIGKPFNGQKAKHEIIKNFNLKSKKIGELCLSGGQVFNGYHENKKETNYRITKDKRNITWYKTGDLVQKNSSGNYIYLGRKDNQIKVRGFRVEIQEVENLIKEITNSNFSAAIGWPRSKENIFSFSGIICFILKQIKMEDKSILNAISKKIPFYSVPQKIIRLKQIPLNTNGKIDYKELILIASNEK